LQDLLTFPTKGKVSFLEINPSQWEILAGLLSSFLRLLEQESRCPYRSAIPDYSGFLTICILPNDIHDRFIMLNTFFTPIAPK